MEISGFTMRSGFIDPPSPFAPLEEWRAFRKEMEAAHRDNPEDEGFKSALANANEAVDKLDRQL